MATTARGGGGQTTPKMQAYGDQAAVEPPTELSCRRQGWHLLSASAFRRTMEIHRASVMQ
eukprot:6671698-Pyramimonas_sp.AAC.1